MNKELSDLAWSLLPKGFKEAVKNRYKNALHFNEYAHECVVLRDLFGEHNLTSDEEEEEILTVKAKVVRDMYAANERLADFPDNEITLTSDHINYVLRQLFGSKCLPDEDSPLKITAAEDCNAMAKEEMGIEEPDDFGKEVNFTTKDELHEDNVHIYDFGKQLDDIIRDRSRHDRLLIAAMAMQGILTSAVMHDGCQQSPEVVAGIALKYADALMAAADKGGEQ